MASSHSDAWCYIGHHGGKDINGLAQCWTLYNVILICQAKYTLGYNSGMMVMRGSYCFLIGFEGYSIGGISCWDYKHTQKPMYEEAIGPREETDCCFAK